jgi:hypothetical protein
MKLEIQYVNDSAGKTKSVQLPLTEWKKLMNRLQKYEQSLKLKNDLTEAFKEIETMKKFKTKKPKLKDFLNEL